MGGRYRKCDVSLILSGKLSKCSIYDYCWWGDILWVAGRHGGTTAVVGVGYHWGAGGG